MGESLRHEEDGGRPQTVQVSVSYLIVIVCCVVLGSAVFAAWYGKHEAFKAREAQVDAYRVFSQQIKHARTKPQEILDKWAEQYETAAWNIASRIYGEEDGQ